MTQIWLAACKDGTEIICEGKLERCDESFWALTDADDNYLIIPAGTIEKILGRKLTWDDEPVIVEETLGQERALGGDTGTSRAENTIYLGDGVYFFPDPYQAEIYITDGISTGNSIYLNQHVALALILALQNWVRGEGR